MAAKSDFDLVISGGGATGCTLALALSQNTPLRIAIIEAHEPSASSLHPGFDARVVALAKQSQLYLDSLGVWDSLASQAEPIHEIVVSDQGHWGKTRVNRAQQQVDALGFVVALETLGQVMMQALDDSLTWLRPNSINAIEAHQEHLHLTLGCGQTVSTALLVNAEGANSPTRALAAIGQDKKPYDQIALIANVKTSQAHRQLAFERFTEYGPLALLPMSGQQMSVVWTQLPERLHWAQTADDTEFLRELQRAFGHRLGRFEAVSQRHAYPLFLQQATSTISHRNALVGNAAQSLHPIAGQGLNLGLRDVAALADTISSTLLAGGDIGAYPSLRQYQRARQDDRQRTVAITDGLVHVFSNNHWPMALGRNAGLVLLDRLGWAKGRFADVTMGRG